MTTRQEMDEATAQRFERAREEQAYWKEHYAQLRSQFPDEFVAVHEHIVIAHRFGIRDLLRDVEEQGIDIRQTWVEFMRTSQQSVIL